MRSVRVRTTSNRGPETIHQKLDPKSGSTKPELATHTSVYRSNSRHMAYSITQGRCCTALQFYSSLFCITFLPSRVINVVTANIYIFNSMVIKIGFTFFGYYERDPLGIPKVTQAMCCALFCEGFFPPNDWFNWFRIPGSESGFDSASIVIMRFIPLLIIKSQYYFIR